MLVYRLRSAVVEKGRSTVERGGMSGLEMLLHVLLASFTPREGAANGFKGGAGHRCANQLS